MDLQRKHLPQVKSFTAWLSQRRWQSCQVGVHCHQLAVMDFFGRMLGFSGASAVPEQIFDMGLKTLK